MDAKLYIVLQFRHLWISTVNIFTAVV